MWDEIDELVDQAVWARYMFACLCGSSIPRYQTPAVPFWDDTDWMYQDLRMWEKERNGQRGDAS